MAIIQCRAGALHGYYLMPRWLFQAVTVFSISVATVIGPTPPGTGVMKAARLEASS